MTSPPDRSLLQLTLPADHPELLTGLDTWLRLGLISDEAVRQLAQARLSCPVPEPIPVPIQTVPVPADRPDSPIPTSPRPASLPTRIAQRFMAEISVVWLLFLGVFLVVVSSGVLAATQWRTFSAIGQYGILFSYTLAFWGASVWTGRRELLRLTTRMLQIAALLLIPVNFWTLDSFGLWWMWGSLLNCLLSGVAAISLSLVTAHILRRGDRHSITLQMAIALGFLHWGWHWNGVPLVATYLGTIGTTIALIDRDRQPNPEAVPIGPIALAAGTLLLVMRSALVVKIPLSQLGLAVGICGWLLCWLARRDTTRKSWAQVGVGLLAIGWLVTVTATPPMQAIAVSGLSLWLLAERLRRSAQVQYLTIGWLVGLQLGWLLWRSLPPNWQQGIITRSLQLAGPDGLLIALLSLGFFPYVVLTLVLAARLRHWQQATLAKHADGLALGLGVVLTALSLGNPLVRSLNLVLSAIVLVAVVWKRDRPSKRLVYLTHATGLAAIAAVLDVSVPQLSLNSWAIVLLVGALAEWGFAVCLRPDRTDFDRPDSANPWQQSTWQFGLILAGFSYALLLLEALEGSQGIWPFGIWLVVPIALTVLGYRRSLPQRSAASRFSVLALLLVQPLMANSATGRLTALGTALVLMLLNSRQLQTGITAVLTIGFGLCFGTVAIWEAGGKAIGADSWMIVGAIALVLLWSLRHWLSRRDGALAGLYKQAADGWAIALFLLTAISLGLVSLSIYADSDNPADGRYLLTAALLLLATSYRTWQRSGDLGFYAIAWSLELIALNVVAYLPRTDENLAIAHLAIALITQLLGDWAIARRSRPALESWNLIPLLYAGAGLFLAHQTFTATTGLYTLAAALVGIGIGRRSRKFLTYVSLLAASFAAFELLVYPLFQSRDTNLGDQIVLIAALAAAIAIAIRLLQRWLAAYTRLSVQELQSIAHVHWAFGSALMPLAIVASLSAMSQWGPLAPVRIGVGLVLAAYALVTGNPRWTAETKNVWIYLGILQALSSLTYLLTLLLPDRVLLEWGGAIAAIVAIALYWIPWHRAGWPQTPWRNFAVGLPGAVILLTAGSVTIQSLLIVAAFYAWLAKAEARIRLSYLSVLLADWAVLRWLSNAREPLWVACVIGGSLLYVAQIDPALRSPDDREKRHWLRCLATGIICLTGFYQAEVGIAGVLPLLLSGLVLALALGFVLVGLLLRVRAFLYIGTIAFVLQVLRQLWLFVTEYSLLLWAIGILLGIVLIWIAATFESRRTQVAALMQYWAIELEAWD